MTNRADKLLLCTDCRKRIFERGTAEASECGCKVGSPGLMLCVRHAFVQNRCRCCGTDLEEDADMARKIAIRARRRRELNAAIKEREPFKEDERLQQSRDKKNSGSTKKVRQRHRPQR